MSHKKDMALVVNISTRTSVEYLNQFLCYPTFEFTHFSTLLSLKRERVRTRTVGISTLPRILLLFRYYFCLMPKLIIGYSKNSTNNKNNSLS